MNKYIATFFNHYNALVFFNYISRIEPANLMPTPRKVSSSCGTCVSFETDKVHTFLHNAEWEIEAIYKETQDGFLRVLAKA